MKTGYSARVLSVFFGLLLCIFEARLFASNHNLKISYLNKPEAEYGWGQVIRDTVLINELIGFNIKADFENNTGAPASITIQVYPHDYQDILLYDWTNERRTLRDGQSYHIDKTVFIKPEAAGTIQFSFDASFNGQINHQAVGVLINVDTVDQSGLTLSQFPRPAILFEEGEFSNDFENPVYNSGTTNIIRWRQAEDTENRFANIYQEAYHFDINNPVYLMQAVRGLYKTQLADTQITAFHDLADGNTYGYVVKSFYEMHDGNTKTLYTDFLYAAQDNTPPEKVTSPAASLSGTGNAVLGWNGVSDALSGVARYNIYRTEGQADEYLVHSYPAGHSANYQWIDPALISGASFYYRITAVDNAGNEGDGEYSNALFFDGDTSIYDERPPVVRPDDPEAKDAYFIAGTRDTIRYTLQGWEQQIQFVSVRGDSGYFENEPAAPALRFSHIYQHGEWNICPDDPGQIYHVFDYSLDQDTGMNFDANFVHNRPYFRRVIASDNLGENYIYSMLTVVPDCFPPGDVRNLKTVSSITDPDPNEPFNGYNAWSVRLDWEGASDDASGLAGYSIQRMIPANSGGIDIFYSEDTMFTDDLTDLDISANTAVNYRIVGIDNAGQSRSFDETEWTAAVKSLGPPSLAFIDGFSGRDTLFSDVNNVDLVIDVEDDENIIAWIVSVNGNESRFSFSEFPNGRVNVNLDLIQFSRIKARVIYQGERSSVWSDVKVVSMYSQRPDRVILNQSHPDSSEWLGHLYLQWNRASLDNERYEVQRRPEGGEWAFADTLVYSGLDTVRWVDRYDFDPIGQSANTLITYQTYDYRVRMVSTNAGQKSAYSEIVSLYCNHPPTITAHKDTFPVNDQHAIRIYWNRSAPSIAQGFWRTEITVARDSIENVIHTDEVVEDSTYLFVGAEPGFSYFFQILEIPQYPAQLRSASSQPYVVNLSVIDSLFAVAQPFNRIYLNWEDDPVLEKFQDQITEYHLIRIPGRENNPWIFPSNQISFMDTEGLEHGVSYTYILKAKNEFQNELAMGAASAISNSGRAFIPDSIQTGTRYFNARRINVNWEWTDAAGNAVEETTLGADSLFIEVSTGSNFPNDPVYTRSTGFFKADPAQRSRLIDIPEAVTLNNDKVYIRMTAKDRWGNPDYSVFSAVTELVYDTVSPHPVSNTSIRSSSANYSESDQIIVLIDWDDLSSELFDEPLMNNIAGYRVIRTHESQIDTSGWIQSVPGQTHYSFQDTILNRFSRWRIETVDSAGNARLGSTAEPRFFIETPPAPAPHDFRSCSIVLPDEYVMPENASFHVEIARDPDHFELAYEFGFDDPENNRLICRSGPLSGNRFECTSGWGSIVMDTTWFRVKVSINDTDSGYIWESGWSALSAYPHSAIHTEDKESYHLNTFIPKAFAVLENYPNPFNMMTTIPYHLPDAARVEVFVYNLRGTVVYSETVGEKQQGVHEYVWYGTDNTNQPAASGIYVFRIRITNHGVTQNQNIKMMLIK